VVDIQLATKNNPKARHESNHDKIFDFVHRWGSSASFALLDSNCQIFTTPHIDGIIGYHTESDCAVVFGDPICAQKKQPELAKAFHKFCVEKKINPIYTMASENFAHWAIGSVSKALLEVTHELVLQPHSHKDPSLGSEGRMLRKKINHALHEGTIISEYKGNNPDLEASLELAEKAWLNNRRGPQIFLANISLFGNREGKRWFYAIKGGDVVGVLLLNRVEARDGWLLNLLFATPQASNGTSELLVSTVLETLRNEQCPFLTFGATPVGELGEIVGLNDFSTWFARKAFRLSKWFFHLDGRRDYWKKFQPKIEPSYILLSKPSVNLGEIRGILRAFHVSV
jgi:lysylphosphatidylglycerol synthetase-like protein (DUF2156 family)